MDDMFQSEQALQSNAALQNKTALELGKLLADHRGVEVVVMDMRDLNFWTDYFIIATVTSDTHSMGLERHIKEFVRERGLEIYRRSRKPEKDKGHSYGDNGSRELSSKELSSYDWRLLDLGGIVIHLMTAGTRSFFELERLWSAAPLIFKGDNAQSSKSS